MEYRKENGAKGKIEIYRGKGGKRKRGIGEKQGYEGKEVMRLMEEIGGNGDIEGKCGVGGKWGLQSISN